MQTYEGASHCLGLKYFHLRTPDLLHLCENFGMIFEKKNSWFTIKGRAYSKKTNMCKHYIFNT